MEEKENKGRLVQFLTDVLRGVAIGVAFIIPGFSGGSVAAILGVYERLVGAIADFFKHFKRSFLTLLPIALGMIVGVAALIYPIRLGLEHFPIPTVSFFVGLALGGLPSVLGKLKGERPKWQQLFAFLLPLAFAASLCFLPTASQPDGFLFHLNFGGYLLLILIGAVGSAALVVPGISGSMLLLIFGYYNPIVDLLLNDLLHGNEIGICLLVLFCLAVGLVLGFFGISHLMKFFLQRFPRGTYFAIVGFILGSVPAVYASTIREAGVLSSNPWYYVAAVAALLVGVALALGFIVLLKRKEKQREKEQRDS